MVDHHLEVERKYETQNGAVTDIEIDWSQLSNYRVQKPVKEHLNATYFDTEEQDLSRNMVALRRRIGGYDQGWHIKFDDRAGARHEMHFDLLKQQKRMPARVSQFVRSVTLGSELSEFVSIETERVRTVLQDAAGTRVAEICEDSVQAVDYSTGIERKWKEWEVELLERGLVDPVQIFEDCERVFSDAGVSPSHSSAKIARALGKDAEFEAYRNNVSLPTGQKNLENKSPRKQPKQDVYLKYSLALLENMVHKLTTNLLLWELKLRAGAPDTVHGMRICTRQIQAVIRFAIRPYVQTTEQAKTLDELLSSLKRLMKGLSAGRDIDIIAEFMGGLEVDSEIVTERSRDELEEFLASDDDLAALAVENLLDSDQYLSLRIGLVELSEKLSEIVDLPAQSENFIAKVSRRMQKQLTSFSKGDFRKLWEENPTEFAVNNAHNDALFEIRRDAQAVRYCLEAFEVAGVQLSREQRKLYVCASELHREISVLSDENVVGQWLETVAVRALQQNLERFAVGYLLGKSHSYAVSLRLGEHAFVPSELSRIKKLDLSADRS